MPAYSKGLPLGTTAAMFSLPGTDGNQWSLDGLADAKLLLVVFTCNHCPYAQAYENRLIAIQKDYAKKGLRIVAINPNDDRTYPDDSFDAMKARAKEKGFNFPYLRDESQHVAKAYNAVCTPDPFLFDEHRKLIYAGRIDDNWKEEASVTREDLREAIEAALKKEPLPFEPVPAMGCSIKWKVLN